MGCAGMSRNVKSILNRGEIHSTTQASSKCVMVINNNSPKKDSNLF